MTVAHWHLRQVVAVDVENSRTLIGRVARGELQLAQMFVTILVTPRMGCKAEFGGEGRRGRRRRRLVGLGDVTQALGAGLGATDLPDEGLGGGVNECAVGVAGAGAIRHLVAAGAGEGGVVVGVRTSGEEGGSQADVMAGEQTRGGLLVLGAVVVEHLHATRPVESHHVEGE